jgi:hypothetical protein
MNTTENFFINIYSWLENILSIAFGNIGYEPIRNLLINPWFWIIIIVLIIVCFIFRRR